MAAHHPQCTIRRILQYAGLSFVLSFCCSGCSTLYTVGEVHSPAHDEPELDYQQLNERLKGEYPVIILMRSGLEYKAKDVRVGYDSTTFLDMLLSRAEVVSTREIVGLLETSLGLGALEGLGIGFLVGGTGGLALGAASSGGCDDREWGAFPCVAGAMLGGIPGGLIGLIIGATSGHTTEYHMVQNSSEYSTKKP